MKKIFLGIIAMFLFSFSQAQSDSKTPVSDNSKIREELKGTYQIQILGFNRDQVSLPDNIYETIKSKRTEDKVAYHYITEKIRIKILPEKIIRAKDFLPIDEQVVLHSFERD
jgi:hypothetical protein